MRPGGGKGKGNAWERQVCKDLPFSRVYPGRTDRRRAFADAEGWDALPGDGVDRVIDLEQPLMGTFKLFSHIECVSVLEHSKAPWSLAANLERLLVPTGTLFLAVPFVWRVHAYPSDYWRFTTDGIRLLFPNVKWSALCYAHFKLYAATSKIAVIKDKGHPYFARTEVYGFGTVA
jgi:SAM-dependent methyltransferase